MDIEVANQGSDQILKTNGLLSIMGGFLTGFGIAIPGLLLTMSNHLQHNYFKAYHHLRIHLKDDCPVPAANLITVAFFCPFATCFGRGMVVWKVFHYGTRRIMLMAFFLTCLGACILFGNILVSFILGTIVLGFGLGMADLVIQMHVEGASQPPAKDRLNETYDTCISVGQVTALALGFATQNVFLHYEGYYIAFLLVGLSSLVLIVHAFHLQDVPIVPQSPHPFHRVYEEFKPPTTITAISKICSSTAGLAVVTMLVPAVYNDLGIYEIHYYLFLMTPASVFGIFASYMLLRRSGRKLSLLLGSAIILVCWL